jgi:hypothetical protein
MRGQYRWFIVKHDNGDQWELPKAHARKGESSVRSAIRNMAEKGEMRAKVLEEIGRSTGIHKIGNQKLPQKYLYYFMIERDSGEPIGFIDSAWLEYNKALKRLDERDKRMLTRAKAMIKGLQKEGRIK